MKVQILSEFTCAVPLSRKCVAWKACGATETDIGISHEVQLEQLQSWLWL